MKRGAVWSAVGGEAYAGKPRPVLILQADQFNATRSVTVCGLTTDDLDAPLIRPIVEPTAENGLRRTSWLMIDKVTTIPRRRLGTRIGSLDKEVMTKAERAIAVFLGLAD